MLFVADRNLRLLFGSLLLWMVGVGLYEGLIPIYARQLGASPVQLGGLFTLRSVALVAGFIIGWMVADRLSRRTLMLASWYLGLPVPLMLAAAPSYIWLLPGLLLYELTFFALPAVHAYVTERVQASELASAFGAMGTVTSVGFLVSPAVGGTIADYWGIRTALVVAFALFLLSTVLILRLEQSGPGAMPVQTTDRLSVRDLAPVAPALAVYVAANFMVVVTVPFLPPFLREARGLSLSEIGVLGSLQAVGAVLLSPIAGRLGDRWGRAHTLMAQTGIWIAGIVLTAYAPRSFLPAAAVLRCRSPLATLTQAMVGASAAPATLGRAFALAGMLSAGLAAAGAFVGGYAYRADAAYPLLLSAGTGIAIMVALLLPPLRRL
ncbi:MAG: MFS transporter [Armatimonadota bacterium]|nr:MFS transporter [Armatimonadota bacterium]